MSAKAQVRRRESAPKRLIDPEGIGAYFLAGQADLRRAAWELLGEASLWRGLDYEPVWMREDDEGLWHPVKWRWWHGFGFHEPTLYAYITPKPESP